MSAASLSKQVHAAPVLCLLLLMMCNSAVAQKWGKVSEEEWNLQPPADYPEAAAVVIFDRGDLSITLDDIIMDRHVRYKIFRKSDAEDVSSQELLFYDDDRVKHFKAHTILPDGDKKKVKEKFEKEVSDFKTLTFAFPNVEDGVILEYKYRLVHERYAMLDPWYFQNETYTLKSQFSATLGPGFYYRTAFVNIPPDMREPVQEVDAYTWTMENQLPLRDEPLAGGRTSLQRAMYFQLVAYRDHWNNIEFAQDWPEIGERVARRIDEFCGDHDCLEAAATSICGDSLGLEARITQLYRFVRDSIESREDLSSTFYDDDKACDILERRFGTGIEKNTLLAALLNAQGIEAHPLFIGTRDFSGFNPDIHQLRQFNHVLCCVMSDSSRAASLDAADRSVGYPNLPPRDLCTGGLLINGEESRAVKLTHADRPSGSQIRSIVMLDRSGAAVCSTSIKIYGYEMNRYEPYLRDSLSQQELAEKMLEDKYDQFSLTSATANFDIEADSIQFQLVFEIPQFATVMDNNLFVNSFIFSLENPFEDDRRFFPVDFKYPFIEHYATNINVPDGMEIADVPPDIEHSIGGAGLVRRAFFGPTSVSTSAMLKINRAVFMPGEYRGLKKLFEIWEDSGSDQIAVAASEQEE